MTTLPANIEQYEQSGAALRGRLAQLNDKIYGRAPLSARETPKDLLERRRFLYTELAELEEAVRLMRAYLRRRAAVQRSLRRSCNGAPPQTPLRERVP